MIHRLRIVRRRDRCAEPSRLRTHPTVPDCTHIHDRRPRTRGAWGVGGRDTRGAPGVGGPRRASPRLVAPAAIAALLAVLALWPVVARADGDPASDVLASQAVFLPQDAGISTVQQSQLGALIAAAGRSGYPIRVALIAAPADLGSVSGLWRRPQDYARFLGQELSLVYRGPLLVVMPNGFGLYGPSRAVAGGEAVLRNIAKPSANADFGTAALTAVQRLSASAGHPLTVPRAAASPAAASTATVPWIVFAVGVALIAAAWAASFRARPLRRRM